MRLHESKLVITNRLKLHLMRGGKTDDDETVALYRAWQKLDEDDETDMEEVERWARSVAYRR